MFHKPRTTSNHQKLEEARTDPSREVSDATWPWWQLDPGLLDYRTVIQQSAVLLSPPLWYFVTCTLYSVTPWTIAQQAPLSMEFSREEHWSRLPSNPGIEPGSPALQAESLLSEPPGKLTVTGAPGDSRPHNLALVDREHEEQLDQWYKPTASSSFAPESHSFLCLLPFTRISLLVLSETV